MQLVIILLLSAILLGASSVLAGEKTYIEYFNKKGQRDGYAIVDPNKGSIDTFDKNSNRSGYGYIDRSRDSITIYDTRGRQGSSTSKGGHITGGGGRR